MDRENVLIPVQTTDGAPVAVPIYRMLQIATLRVTVIVVARAVDGSSKSWNMTRTIKNMAGNLSSVSAASADVSEGDLAAGSWAASLSTSGLNIVVTLTGAIGTVINWSIQPSIVLA